MNDDLHSDPTNTSSEPETLKALVTVPRPSRERYPTIANYAEIAASRDYIEALDELDRLEQERSDAVHDWSEAQATVGRLTQSRDTARLKAEEIILDRIQIRAERDRLRAEVDRLTTYLDLAHGNFDAALSDYNDERANSDRLAELLGVQYETVGVLTTIEPDVRIALAAHRALRAPVEGEPQHD